MSEYHTPVLLDASVSALVTNPSGLYIDATFGGGVTPPGYFHA